MANNVFYATNGRIIIDSAGKIELQPTAPPPFSVNPVVATNVNFPITITDTGKAWGWGYNLRGQLGNYTAVSTSNPSAVCGNHTFVKITTGINHTLAIDYKGKAWSWGVNSALGVGVGSLNKSTPIAVYGVKTFCQIASNGNHSKAIDNHGKGWGWGSNYYGSLGDNTVTTRATPVAICGVHTFCQIAANWNGGLAIDKDGKLWGWGQNNYGTIGDYTAVSKRTPVAVAGTTKTFCFIGASKYANHAIEYTGKAWGWGRNQYGNVGDNTAFVSVMPHRSTPVAVCGNHTFCKIAGGQSHTMGIDYKGKAWGWGSNYFGELGNNATSGAYTKTPIAVCGIHTFCQISVGMYFNIAVDNNKKVYTWGRNQSGQLGDNSTTNRLTPILITI